MMMEGYTVKEIYIGEFALLDNQENLDRFLEQLMIEGFKIDIGGWLRYAYSEFIQLALEVGSKLKVITSVEDLSGSFYLNLFHLNAFEQPETVAVYLIDDESIKTDSPGIQEIHQQLQQEPNLSDYLVTVDEVEVILNLTK